MKKLLCCLLLLVPSLWAEEDVKEIYWDDLLPKGFVVPEVKDKSFYEQNPELQVQQNKDAPVVETLNNKKVKIPGFVVPIEGDDKTVKEFLLVPYFGACIHVPPPPANQIVFVTFEKGAPVDDLYDAIWVEGTLSTEGWEGDIAAVGYTLKATKVTPYE